MKVLMILVVLAVSSSGSSVNACDAVALMSCTLPTPGGNNVCGSLTTYRTCVENAGCFYGAVESEYNTALTAAQCVSSSGSSVNACDALALMSCTLPTPGGNNVCGSLATYRTCVDNAGCFSGSIESQYNVLLTTAQCVSSSGSSVNACDTVALTSCTLPTPGGNNVCGSLTTYRTCVENAGCFYGAVESQYNALLTTAQCVSSPGSSVNTCDTVALTSCTLPTPGGNNVCGSLATYRTCVDNAGCFSGSVESGYTAALTAAKCVSSSGSNVNACDTVALTSCTLPTPGGNNVCGSLATYRTCVENAGCFYGAVETAYNTLLTTTQCVSSSGSSVNACDTVALTSCTLPTPGGNNFCSSLATYRTCVDNAGCFYGAVETAYNTVLTVAQCVGNSGSNVNACDAQALASCTLPTPGGNNVCGSLATYKTCLDNAGCFYGAVESAYNTALTAAQCVGSSGSSVNTCDSQALASCTLPAPGGNNVCGSLATYKTCLDNAGCFYGSVENGYNAALTAAQCVGSSGSNVNACDEQALASCTLPTPGGNNVCGSLATYKTCADNAGCFSGSVESGYNSGMTAAKCGACMAKISLSLLSVTAALFLLKKMM